MYSMLHFLCTRVQSNRPTSLSDESLSMNVTQTQKLTNSPLKVLKKLKILLFRQNRGQINIKLHLYPWKHAYSPAEAPTTKAST
jgi:hypothetical protein